MKESTFISKNEDDWKNLEHLLNQPDRDADKLLGLFEKVSGDLAYARTYYPNRSIRVYLNNLTQEVLNSINKKKKKFELRDILNFYKHTLPYEIYQSRHAFYTSFCAFVIAVLIGVVSSANSPDFCNIILGDEYVSETEENINKGDPMAIYKDSDKGSMFMRITTNNIRVSFLCFVMGLLGGVGTIIVLLFNGIMVGAFQYYFYSKGLFLTSFLTIWIHGTIEISAIIIAGAAGIILGNGLLLPKSYDRHTSLIIAAKRALKIILAIIPLFIIAGFLESYVTRLTDLPMIVKIAIIAGSLFFILLVFVIYPIICARRGFVESDYDDIEPTLIENIETEKYKYKPFAEVMSAAFAETRIAFGPFLYHFLLPATIVYGICLFFVLKFRVLTEIGLPEDMSFNAWKYVSFPQLIVFIVLVSWCFILCMMLANRSELGVMSKLKYVKKNFIKVAPLAAIFLFGYFFIDNEWVWLTFLVIPIQFIFMNFQDFSLDTKGGFKKVLKNLSFSFIRWFDFVLISLMMVFFLTGIQLLFNSGLVTHLISFISWHDIFGNYLADQIFIREMLNFIMLTLPLPLFYFAYTYQYASLDSLVHATDLKRKFKDFGTIEDRFNRVHV